MASDKSCCVLCGRETNLFNRYVRTFYDVSQTFCSLCVDRYDHAAGQERADLVQRILASPELKERNTVRQRYEAEIARQQAEQRAKQEARLTQDETLQDRLAWQENSLTCCGQAMTPLGTSQFQLGEHTFFLGDWSHLLSGSMRLSIFRCSRCGQFKFFDPDFL